ncbi:NADPH-dependent 7-cyano-7-deazaguanine reductase QueF [Desulfocicer niacini]
MLQNMSNNPMQKNTASGIPLGRQVGHSKTYDPSQLFCVPRRDARKNLGITESLPFYGVDIWNAYEVSWLDKNGKPCVAAGEILFPCTSENIIESKSLKLYLNSFNFTRFESPENVQETIIRDLSCQAGAASGSGRVEGGYSGAASAGGTDSVAGPGGGLRVEVNLFMPEAFDMLAIKPPRGTCLDGIEIKDEIDAYELNPSFLKTLPGKVEETLFSNLLRTNCPVTGQPDWATVMIHYRGNIMDHEGLLRYIISLRQHEGFHENCVELIFMDILNQCSPEFLTVQARFTRRGGLDINPCRSTAETHFSNTRFARQ